jgi:hypothetical protein
MKELELHDRIRQDIHIEAPWKQEFKLIGSIRMEKGVKLFALSTTSWELTEVVTKDEVMLTLDGEIETKKKAFHSAEYIYIKAINRKNAERKAARIIRQHIKDSVRNALNQSK